MASSRAMLQQAQCGCFRLAPVAERILYLDAIRNTESYLELCLLILQFRSHCPEIKKWTNLPM
jgi:hypothetical protein